MTKGNKLKKKKKKNRGLGTCGYNRISNINMIGVPEEEKKEGDAEKVLKDIMDKNFSNLAEDRTTD